jgi:formylglycine-generating enzyme required for sulfatase activity
VAYAAWPSNVTGKSYRLPSEAEWEYACRAGTQTAYWWGDVFDPAQAFTDESGLETTSNVGSYPANPWGLSDMLGNVWEWVADHYHSNYEDSRSDIRAWTNPRAPDGRLRVLRGGRHEEDPNDARCARRGCNGADGSSRDIGFRVACSPRL